MTTNKPEVVAWGIFFGKTLQEFGYTQEAAEAIAKTEYSDVKVTVEPLIRLSDYEALQAECEALRKDAGRLDFLDARNRPLKMGWSVSDAPAGNVSIMSMNVSIISIMSIGGREPTSIRSAIDAAMAKEAHP